MIQRKKDCVMRLIIALTFYQFDRPFPMSEGITPYIR